MRTRRVGSFTCGMILILFGVLFLLHMFLPEISYHFIFRLWPLVLIFLGAELLLSNWKATETILKYDTGAVIIVLLLSLFSMGMAATEFFLRYLPEMFGAEKLLMNRCADRELFAQTVTTELMKKIDNAILEMVYFR